MTAAVHAEWTKLRTVSATFWLLLGAIVATVFVSSVIIGAVSCSPIDCGGDPHRLMLTGVYLGQAVVAILGVIAIGNEYGTGMIGLSLAAMPRRLVLLAAKAVTLAGAVLVAAIVAIGLSLLIARLVMPGNGFTAANNHPHLFSLSEGATPRAVVGTILYLVLIALLSLGIAAIVRNSATAMGLVLGLLYLPLLIGSLLPGARWQEYLEKYAPMSAGLAIQAGDTRGLPIGPWAGLGVLALWAAAALLCGGLLLVRRDA
ncbi:ABC transporter permease [Micromonospora sp. CPCC 205371]|nr:ABC transporter permease [Micromonospora sp. CPCC 205371]